MEKQETEEAKLTPQLQCRANEIKFFHKHVIEGKTGNQCAAELGVNKNTASNYKHSDTYRQMALAHLDKKLNGVESVIDNLVTSLDAMRPHNVQKTKKDKEGNIETITEVVWVADQSTRMKAILEINRIYGIHAPQKKDITVAVSLSSDEQLFAEIDEAERSSRFVESYTQGEGGLELAPDPQGPSSGDFSSRKRTLLQGTAVPE